jgi:hypothetical protein
MVMTMLPAAVTPELEVARALADPLRWRIVALLAAEELGVGQPLVSHHL